MLRSMMLRFLLGAALVAMLASCTQEADVTPFTSPCDGLSDPAARETCFDQRGIRVTFLHTSDWHSRLLPYDLDVLATDERLGLLQSNEPFGGAARMAHVLKRERANADRSMHLDSGDCFQGAPIFNEFLGEPEIKAMNEIGVDAVVIGNHEFDNGVLNLYDKLSLAQYPVLAANYIWKPSQGQEQAPLNQIARPYTIVDIDGVRVGVIGMANFSSLSSISYGDSGLGIQVLESVQVVQNYVDLLSSQANIIVVLTHLGLGEDEEVIRQTSGVDIVFGGHLHVVLNPPKVIPDKTGRLVPLVHSGAFMKYVGRLDTVFTPHPDEPHNLELRTHDYEAIPIDSTIPEDPDMVHLMAPYERELARRIDLRRVIGYTPEPLRRFGTGGGDSPLGNFLADAMLLRERVEVDVSATNSLGIRADINRGEITIDQMYNVFPFPNTIATMTLSGNEVQELLDFNTYRSAGRGCATQLQVAGVEYELDCDTVNNEIERVLEEENRIYEFEFRDQSVKFAKDIRIIRGGCFSAADCTPGIAVCTNDLGDTCDLGADVADYGSCRCREELQPQFFYKFASNDYMARGGSGFRSLRFNTTQSDTGVDLRDAIIEAIEQAPSCSERCAREFPETFDPERPGTCNTLNLCKADLTAYESRFCEGFDIHSDQDRCLEANGAPRCLALRRESDYELCLRTTYRDCQELFTRDAIQQCYEDREAAEALCADSERVSPFEFCVEEDAPQCADEFATSEYDACVNLARTKAEVLCPDLPCPTAESDGRQVPIPPRNEELEGGTTGGDPVKTMESLQATGEDACY